MRKSVPSINPYKPALPSGRSVIQTTYDIIKAHAGTINVESDQNVGMTFSITLPFV